MGLIDGIKDVATGISRVCVGIIKAAFAFLKFVLLAAVCVIVGVYSAIKGIFSFAKKAYNKLKKERPGVKVTAGGSATKKVLTKVLRDIKKEVSENTLKLSELERDDVLNDVQAVENKISNGEANGMHWIEGTNEQGEEELFDAELIKYDKLGADAQRRDNNETAFIEKIA